jgi:subtilisin family serine protease
MLKQVAMAGFAALAVAACSDSSIPTGTTRTDALGSVSGQPIPNRYVVEFKPGMAVGNVATEANRIVNADGGRLHFTYEHSIRGFAADLSDKAVAALRANPLVASVEQDRIVTIQATQAPTPSWGLDRIDQVSLPLNNSYTYPNTGAGVHVYGIDTGILYTHTDFGGRASKGFDAITAGGNAVDCNGHGTHTASNIAGSTYGVAKAATVIGVRVLDCGGTGAFSQVIAGVDWVAAHRIRPAVANMSLGGGVFQALDNAVTAAIDSGVVFAVAAGNSSGDACLTTPARAPRALTVAASTITDGKASFSNFGSCVDIFGPGTNITAAWIGSNTATNTISGTSMATPHVAGAAALYLAANPTATPAQVATALLANASAKITNPGANTTNKLVYIGFIGGGTTPPPNQPPTANFTISCTPAHTCTYDASSSTDDHGVVSYSWANGVGRALGTGRVLTKQYAEGGNAKVILTVADASGLTGTLTKAFVIP